MFITSATCEWLSLSKKLVSEPNTEWEFIDGSCVKAHQHSAGASGFDPQDSGKSRAGNTTKIHLAVDSDGLPIEFTVTGGEIHDGTAASELIEPLPPAKAVVADKGYDSEKIRGQTRSKGAIVVIPRKSNSVIDNAYMDGSLYRHRHLVENAFARLKHFRGLATRYDKLKRNDQSGVATVCGFLWLLM
jgi:transposase